MHGPNFHNPPPDIIDGEPEWEVKEIMGLRKFERKKKLQYHVQWKGYSTFHNFWKPAKSVYAPELIKSFESQQKDKKRGMSNELLLSSPRVISINNIMVSHDSSYNDLGTALMEQAAINIMQAAQKEAQDRHISVESSPQSSHSFDIEGQVGICSNLRRSSMPYVPATPTETLTTEQTSSEELSLYIPPP